jgi:hypothetical protein
MTKIISLRLPEDEVLECDRRAAERGLSRTEYVRGLITRDLTAPEPGGATAYAFKSWGVVGKYPSGRGGTNADADRAMTEAFDRKRERNR